MTDLDRALGGDPPSQPEPARPARPRTRTRNVLTPQYEYVSASIDTAVDDLDTYESVRRQEVEETLAYFEQVRQPLSAALQQPLRIMEGRIADPYAGLRLPDNLSVVSLSDLQELAGKALNAYLTYGEWLSAARSLSALRSDLHDRRVKRASINEGSNDIERKALAAMRSEPEALMLSRVTIVKDWVETRYFMYQRMMDVLTQMLTTKSVEATRQMKDAEHEGRSY